MLSKKCACLFHLSYKFSCELLKILIKCFNNRKRWNARIIFSLSFSKIYVCDRCDIHSFIYSTQMFYNKTHMAPQYSAPKELKFRHVRNTSAKCIGTSYRVCWLHNRNLGLNVEQTSQLVGHSCLANTRYIRRELMKPHTIKHSCLFC